MKAYPVMFLCAVMGVCRGGFYDCLVRDENKSCGTQPANVGVINCCKNGCAPFGYLGKEPQQGPLKNSWQRVLFYLDNCQPYQGPEKNHTLLFFLPACGIKSTDTYLMYAPTYVVNK
jgi:hypothetical protein